MDEIVNMVSQKTGLPKDQAQEAVNVVVGFIKERLPAPLAGQIDGLLGGSSTGNMNMGGMAQEAEGMMGDMTKKMGDLFGNR